MTRLLGMPVLGGDTAIYYICPGYLLVGAVLYHNCIIASVKASLYFAVWLLATSLTASRYGTIPKAQLSMPNSFMSIFSAGCVGGIFYFYLDSKRSSYIVVKFFVCVDLYSF